MRSSLVSRRFGRGAGRLPVGRPAGSPSLARLAESGGGPAWIVPLAPAALAVLLALGLDDERDPSTSAPSPDTRDQPTRIAWVEWPESIPRPSRAARPVPSRPARQRDPEPTPLPTAAPEQSPGDDAPRETLDLATLLTAAPRVGLADGPAPWPGAGTLHAIGATAARPPVLPTPADLAAMRPAGAEEAVPSPLESASPPPRDLAGVRPVTANGPTGAPAPALEAMAGGLARAERVAALDAAGQAAGRGLPAPADLPPVAAAATRDADVARRVRDDVAREARDAGWHEVPLDELPDCSPPGRQDRLKQQIMQAAESRSTCRHPAGAYRFVETRNLNAFLMWSRIQPDVGAGSKGVRDACEVLSRALECLATSSTKEFQAR